MLKLVACLFLFLIGFDGVALAHPVDDTLVPVRSILPQVPASVPLDYVVTPFGYFHPSCVHSVRQEDVILNSGDIRLANGDTETVSPCPYPRYSKSGQVMTSDRPIVAAGSFDSPPVQGGNYLESVLSLAPNLPVGSSGEQQGYITEMIGSWIVPPSPANASNQIIYLFIGAQAKNVTSSTSIIQPVLAWQGNAWTITPWNCCVGSSPYHGTSLAAKSGDNIYGKLYAENNDSDFKIIITNNTTGATSSYISSGGSASPDSPSADLAVLAALEAYGVTSCDELPANSGITFSNQSDYVNYEGSGGFGWYPGSNSPGPSTYQIPAPSPGNVDCVYKPTTYNSMSSQYSNGFPVDLSWTSINAPTNLSAVSGSGKITLTWTESNVGPVSNFGVKEATSSGGEQLTSPDVIQTTTPTATISGLTNGTTYFFKVRAYGSGSAIGSALSSEVQVTAGGAEPPTNLSASPGVKQATLSWTASADASSYNVYLGSNAGGESATPVLTGVSATTAVVTGLSDGSTYYFTVKAVNSVSTSLASNEASATLTPDAPASLSAVAGTSQATLTWAASGGATSYNIYEGTAPGGESGTPAVSGITGTSTTITSLKNGTTYYFVVSAVNATGASQYSPETSVTLIPNAPTGLSATPLQSAASLTWSASTGASSYNIYQGATSGAESSTAVATGITSTSATVNSLMPKSTYYFTVKAVNSAGTSPPSNEASVTTLAATALPSSPTNLTANAATRGTQCKTTGSNPVTLSWSAGSGASSYSVLLGTTAGGESATPYSTGITTTTTQIQNLTIGQTYYFKVLSVNNIGSSSPSNEASATVLKYASICGHG